MMFRTVGADHPITLGNLPAKPAKDLALSYPAHFTVLCLDGRRLVGFLRYEYDRKGTLCAAGTWVAPEARGKGIAADLWRHLLRRARPRAVWVRTVSVGGRALVSSLVREFPKFRWIVV